MISIQTHWPVCVLSEASHLITPASEIDTVPPEIDTVPP